MLAKEGFRVRTRFPFHLTIAIQKAFPMFGVDKLQPPKATRETTVRGVPTDIPLEDLRKDLADYLGDAFISVRRLHALTEGKPDPQRPLPVIMVRGVANSIGSLGQWRIFNAIPVKIGTEREVERPLQCSRCWAWGHRAGACSSRKRCVRCGSMAHDISKCHQENANTHCFACKGAHSVRWAGCPERRKEEDRVAAALAATSAVQPSRNTPATKLVTRDVSVKAGVSYASRVAQPSPQVETRNRFQLLSRPEEPQQMDTPDPTPREFAASKRKREIAYALREKKATMTDLEADLAAIASARAVKPNTALTKRYRATNAKLATLRLRIRELEAERRGLSSAADPPSRPPSHPSSPSRTRAQPVSQPAGSSGPSAPPGPSSLLTVLSQLLRSLWGQVRGLLLEVPLLGSLVPWIDVQLGFAAGESQ